MSVTGGFPTASLAVAILFPLLGDVPYIPRMMIVTALVVVAMYWFIMPRLLRWLARMGGKEGLSARDTFIEGAAGRLTDKSGNQKLEFR